MLFKHNKLSSRTAGKAKGTRATAQSTSSACPPDAPAGHMPEARTTHGHAARRLSRKPREGPCRGRNKQTAGKAADSVRRLTVAGRGASVSRTAGQHDDAEKAGDTSRHAKAGKAAGRPISKEKRFHFADVIKSAGEGATRDVRNGYARRAYSAHMSSSKEIMELCGEWE